jgi:hypothetical protein
MCDIALHSAHGVAKVCPELRYPIGDALQHAYTRTFFEKAGDNAAPNPRTSTRD